MSKGSREAVGVGQEADSYSSADIVDLMNLEDEDESDIELDPRGTPSTAPTAAAAAAAEKRGKKQPRLLITATKQLREQHPRAVAVAESILRQLGQPGEAPGALELLHDSEMLRWMGCQAVADAQGRQASVQALYTATNEHGSGMTGDLALRADAAANLIRLCGQVLGTDDATVQAAQAALDGWNAAADAGGPADQFAANTALGSAVGTMYNKVYDNDKMNEDIERQYAVFLSAQSTITHTAEEYNSTARQYNNSLKSFPANILAGLWGMEEVELFQ